MTQGFETAGYLQRYGDVGHYRARGPYLASQVDLQNNSKNIVGIGDRAQRPRRSDMVRLFEWTRYQDPQRADIRSPRMEHKVQRPSLR
jgi:hypothetical protein